jgi:PAS domain S-box-containing protein
LISDTKNEPEWTTFKGHSHLSSWISVPLRASDQYLGFLSIGHTDPHQFTQEHLRRAELLAIPAAAAIQNARLFARAEIYGEELERRIAALRLAKSALVHSEGTRRASEEKFQTVFERSPIAFSITTLEEGRFLDINLAFEERYGFSRSELIGRTAHGLTIWENPRDRELLVMHLKQHGSVQHFIVRLRAKSGEIKLTAYSAVRIEFEGQSCVLAVSEDIPALNSQQTN